MLRTITPVNVSSHRRLDLGSLHASSFFLSLSHSLVPSQMCDTRQRFNRVCWHRISKLFSVLLLLFLWLCFSYYQYSLLFYIRCFLSFLRIGWCDRWQKEKKIGVRPEHWESSCSWAYAVRAFVCVCTVLSYWMTNASLNECTSVNMS